jgi:hypothetical protein
MNRTKRRNHPIGNTVRASRQPLRPASRENAMKPVQAVLQKVEVEFTGAGIRKGLHFDVWLLAFLGNMLTNMNPAKMNTNGNTLKQNTIKDTSE